jgi:hypothetical protein
MFDVDHFGLNINPKVHIYDEGLQVLHATYACLFGQPIFPEEEFNADWYKRPIDVYNPQTGVTVTFYSSNFKPSQFAEYRTTYNDKALWLRVWIDIPTMLKHFKGSN